jgi:hypothetical protein
VAKLDIRGGLKIRYVARRMRVRLPPPAPTTTTTYTAPRHACHTLHTHHGATGLAGGGPAARYRGTVRVHALQSIAQVLLVHDRVPPIDGLGLVAGDLHGDGPRNPGMLNVPDGGSPQIVEEAARHLRLLARPTPRAAELLDALTPAWNTWATRASIARPRRDRQGELRHMRPGKPWDCHRPRRARGVARVALWCCPRHPALPGGAEGAVAEG